MGSVRARALIDGCKHSTLQSQLFKCAKPDPSALGIYLFSLSDSLRPGSRAKCALRVAVWDANGDFWASPFLHPALKRRIAVLCTPSWCFYFSLLFMYIRYLGWGFVRIDVPHAVPSCCSPTKRVKERERGVEGQGTAGLGASVHCQWRVQWYHFSRESFVSKPTACRGWRVSVRPVACLAPQGSGTKLCELPELDSSY